MWLVLLLISATVALWVYYKKTYFVWTNQGVKQTNPWPFLGDTWVSIFQLMNIMEFTEKLYNMCPGTRYYGCYQLQKPILLLKDLDLIKQIAIKDFDHFTDHRGTGSTEESDPLFSKNLFVLKGQKWRDMRALLSGSFTSNKMKIMYKLIAEASEKFANHFTKNSEDQFEIELKDEFTRYTNDVIASTAFGIEVDSLSEPNNEFYRMGLDLTNFTSFFVMLKIFGNMIFPKLYQFFKIPILSKKSSSFFTEVIDQTIKAREEQHIVRPDMLNLLLEVRKNGIQEETSAVDDSSFAVVEESQHIAKHHKKHIEMTDLDITAQAVIFFLAGFDTVSTAMSSCCYELAINPEVQDKLRDEIKKVFEESDESITYETVLNMKYLDMVVSESLRKYPGLVFIDRLCTKPYTIEPARPNERPVHIKKGHLVWIPAYVIHHDPEYYPDPEKFIPERFSNKNKANIKPYSYLPFGIGPRACIGSRFALLEMKMVLIYLLRKFQLVPVQKTKIPLEFGKTSLNVVSKNGYHIAFKKIK